MGFKWRLNEFQGVLEILEVLGWVTRGLLMLPHISHLFQLYIYSCLYIIG